MLITHSKSIEIHTDVHIFMSLCVFVHTLCDSLWVLTVFALVLTAAGEKR